MNIVTGNHKQYLAISQYKERLQYTSHVDTSFTSLVIIFACPDLSSSGGALHAESSLSCWAKFTCDLQWLCWTDYTYKEDTDPA